VFAELHRLQHPPECRSARKLHCTFHKGCGFGCEVSRVCRVGGRQCLLAKQAFNKSNLILPEVFLKATFHLFCCIKFVSFSQKKTLRV
jgi:hypothetical protein